MVVHRWNGTGIRHRHRRRRIRQRLRGRLDVVIISYHPGSGSDVLWRRLCGCFCGEAKRIRQCGRLCDAARRIGNRRSGSHRGEQLRTSLYCRIYELDELAGDCGGGPAVSRRGGRCSGRVFEHKWNGVDHGCPLTWEAAIWTRPLRWRRPGRQPLRGRHHLIRPIFP